MAGSSAYRPYTHSICISPVSPKSAHPSEPRRSTAFGLPWIRAARRSRARAISGQALAMDADLQGLVLASAPYPHCPPPSMSITVPDRYSTCGAHSIAASAPTSDGRFSRPNGIRLSSSNSLQRDSSPNFDAARDL